MRFVYTLALVVFVMVALATPASAALNVRVFGGGSSNYCSTGDPDLFGGGAVGMSNGMIGVEIGGYGNACQELPSAVFASLAVFPIHEGKLRLGLGASLDYDPSGLGETWVRPEGIVLYSIYQKGTKKGPDPAKHYAESGILLDGRVGVRNSSPYATVGFMFYFN